MKLLKALRVPTRRLTRRWSEPRAALRSTFEMTSTPSTPSDARPRPPSLILFSLDLVRRAFSPSWFAVVFLVACASCSTLQPDVHTSGAVPVSWSDVREIERLLPVAHIQEPIDEIQRPTPDEIRVFCAPRRPQPGRHGWVFRAHRRNGQWVLDRSSVDTYDPVYLD